MTDIYCRSAIHDNNLLPSQEDIDYFVIISLPLSPEESNSSTVHQAAKQFALEEVLCVLLEMFEADDAPLTAIDWLLSNNPENVSSLVNQACAQKTTRSSVKHLSSAAKMVSSAIFAKRRTVENEHISKVKAHKVQLNATEFPKAIC